MGPADLGEPPPSPSTKQESGEEHSYPAPPALLSRLAHLNRVYATLSRVNDAIARTGDRQALLEEVCRIVHESGLYRLAFVAMFDPVRGDLKPAAYAGVAPPVAENVRITARDEPEGQGAVGQAVRTGRPCVIRHALEDPRLAPWRHILADIGAQSVAAFPLRARDRLFGVLAVYSTDPIAFDTEETELLDRVAANLSVALDRFEKEQQRLHAEEARRRAEEALRASEARYRQIVETAAEGIGLVSPSGRILFANHAFAEMLGLDLHALLGCSLREIVDEEGWSEYLRRVERRRQGHRAKDRFEFRFRRSDGTSVWTLVSTSPLLDDNGRYLGTLGMVTDISPLKWAEAELRRRQEELERAKEAAEASARAKSEFLALASHEIRTPISGVLGLAELLLETPLDGRQREMVSTIRTSAETLLRVINDLLDLARMEAGKLPVRAEPFDLESLIRQVIALLKPLADKKGLALLVRYPDELPRRFLGDADRVAQILLNLTGNAIKFTPSGHVRVGVDMRTGENGGRLRISVEDTGPGIAEQKQQELFQRFARLPAPNQPRLPGAGLGLAISKNLVELMGGRIGVDSRPGAGSTFWFELDLPLAPDPPPPPHPRAAESDSSPSALSLQVLLAEDDPVSRQVARRTLERLGCRVDVASDGEEALRLHARRRYDLILLDCEMPALDGYETAREIRRREPQHDRTPILALTASASADVIARCRDAGIDDLLAKPLRSNELEAVLRRMRPHAAAPRS